MPIVRDAAETDAPELAALINELIEIGGTTALEEPFAASRLAETYLTGPRVFCCFIANAEESGEALGFQTLLRDSELPDDWGDIGTFTRAGMNQRGTGTALFAATRQRAQSLNLSGINATIRADNSGGLAYYSRMGFADHSIERGVPLKDGTPVDRISKRLTL